MEVINVLNEILKWSLERPPWQRDALRRLVTKVNLMRRTSQSYRTSANQGTGWEIERTPFHSIQATSLIQATVISLWC